MSGCPTTVAGRCPAPVPQSAICTRNRPSYTCGQHWIRRSPPQSSCCAQAADRETRLVDGPGGMETLSRWCESVSAGVSVVPHRAPSVPGPALLPERGCLARSSGPGRPVTATAPAGVGHGRRLGALPLGLTQLLPDPRGVLGRYLMEVEGLFIPGSNGEGKAPQMEDAVEHAHDRLLRVHALEGGFGESPSPYSQAASRHARSSDGEPGSRIIYVL